VKEDDGGGETDWRVLREVLFFTSLPAADEFWLLRRVGTALVDFGHLVPAEAFGLGGLMGLVGS